VGGDDDVLLAMGEEGTRAPAWLVFLLHFLGVAAGGLALELLVLDGEELAAQAFEL